MNTLNYIGSKKTLLNTILKVLKDNIEDINDRDFADLFAGTGTVGFNVNINNICKSVTSNDLEYYSYIINSALLESVYSEKIQKIIDELNNTEELIEGLIYKNFSNHEGCERMFFTNKNAKKCDTIRIKINELLLNETINKAEFNFLLASIIVSIDKYANTSSVYGAYLKKFKKSSLKEFILKPIHTNKKYNPHNNVFNKKIETLVKEEEFDIVYLDPPYNSRQYLPNYHLLETIAKYDDPKIKGKTGIREYENQKSNFCIKSYAEDALESLIKNSNFRYILLSYNSEGIISERKLEKLLKSYSNKLFKKYRFDYRRYKKDKKTNKDKLYELIHVIDKN